MLHIFNDPKFSSSFFEFLIRNGVSLSGNYLFHYRCTRSTCKKYGMPAIFARNFFSPVANVLLLKPLFQSEKIIIHCLASPFLLFYLYLFPHLARKSYWSIWGKDLYFYRTLSRKRFYHHIYEYFRRKVIGNISHVITFTEGDYELAKKWYGCPARLHKCFMYPSNLYKSYTDVKYDRNDDLIVILAGNSADPSNNHLEIFSLLEKFKDDNIEIVVPLPYGNKQYAQNVIKRGQNLFGSKIYFFEQLLPLPEYLDLLRRVDIGVFAHKRQQAMGNIITLLGMGKKVFMRSDITSWKTLTELNVKIFDIYNIDLKRLDMNTRLINVNAIKSTYSEENLLSQWNEIVNSTL